MMPSILKLLWNPWCMTSLKIWFFSLQFNFFNHVLQNITLHCRVKRTEANCQSWRHCCGYSFQFSERARGDGKLQSGSQSETDAALLVASPSWASRIWPCCEHLTQSCFLKVLSFLTHKSRALEVTFSGVFLCAFLASPLVLLCPIEVPILEILK